MPTVNQLAPATTLNFDNYSDPVAQLEQAAGIDGSTLLHKSSTGFMWGRSVPLGTTGQSQILPGSVIIQGENITYDGNGLPSGGTITHISISLGGIVLPGNVFSSTPMLQIAGLSMDIASLGDELVQAFFGNTAPLENYFRNLPWTFNGSNGEDAFVGGNLADLIRGNDDADYLGGGAGADKLFGGAGDDHLIGGSGADYLSGGTDSDTAGYGTATSGVTVSLTNAALNTGDAKGDTYNSIENLAGSDFNDKFYGTAGANTLLGGNGNDLLVGYAGGDNLYGGTANDTLIGGAGADYLKGAEGIDTASYAGAAVRVIASLANSNINTDDAKGDTYVEVENLVGSSFGDILYGDNFRNVINGGAGNDIIKGYKGNDVLTGGLGKDVFIFNSAPNGSTNVDTITDFNRVDDTIQLENAIFQALTSTGTLSSAAFRANTTGLAGDANDRIIYETDTGEIYYDYNGSAAGGGIEIATLSTKPVITYADFVVI